MKKRHFKTWIDYSIKIINFYILLLIAGLETKDLKSDIILTIILLIIFIMNHKLLKKYSKNY